ncbi:hypothetical protein Hsw_2095 [Hymenobacter swuensis DY53]|uniref:Uncharacterized protein n=1 Tax=Hymenobacter swuensis DY53 TaxID=1227739 RepID=W8F7H4_9BACT|nr:hypothetical protein Hsw_2095 [Hymenobacter swuensis DY53]
MSAGGYRGGGGMAFCYFGRPSPRPMLAILTDIRQRLKTGDYENEEHVRLSLVARIVQALG